MFKNIADLKITKLLLIYPHPDDEAYFGAGLIWSLHQQNTPVDILILTKGEKTTHRFGLKFEDNISEIRESEFFTASRLLGVSKYRICNYPDGGLLETAGWHQEIITEIAESKPSHLLTFEPGGVYGHPDHIAVSKFITDHLRESSIGIELIYSTLPVNFKLKGVSPEFATKMRKSAPIEPNIHFQYGLITLWKKYQIFKAYSSQVKQSFGFWWEWVERKSLFSEWYKFVGKKNNQG